AASALRRCHCPVAARRETDHADPFRIDTPPSGLAPYQADGALGILERASSRLAPGLVRAPRHAVLEDDAGHAERVQPGSDLLAFELPVKVPVAASWTRQPRATIILLLCRLIARTPR